MFREFIAFSIENNLLLQEEEKVLLTVSGGVDSVVMTHLFYCADIPFAIGHCNFKLRGNESDKDEIFVRQLAINYDVPFHSVAFDTEKFAATNKLSIQMAARRLRYDWFETIRSENNYQNIATAHHKDDSVETFLLNLSRGTGIRGLHGISPKKDKLIRPLLFAGKTAILKYAADNDLAYRTDASNASVKYDRNFVRHEIIPLFQKLNPSFIKSIDDTSRKLRDVERFFDYFFEKIKREAVTKDLDIVKIDLEKITQYPFISLLLFELLSPYGFNATQINNLHKSLETPTGKTFYSPDYHLIINKKRLLIKKRTKQKQPVFSIDLNQKTIALGKDEKLTLTTLKTVPIELATGKNRVLLDADILEFPLQIRRWKKGDYFHPLGMKGKRKKIKELFTDLKLSPFEKEKIWLVTSGKQICWVIGYRIDERFKITKHTKNAIEMIFSKK